MLRLGYATRLQCKLTLSLQIPTNTLHDNAFQGYQVQFCTVWSWLSPSDDAFPYHPSAGFIRPPLPS